jgi:hypothetical protein
MVVVVIHFCHKKRTRKPFHSFGPEQGCQMVYFQTKNYQFWLILEGLGIEKTGICIITD